MYIESATVTTSPHLYDNKIELVLTEASDGDCQNLADIFKETRHLGFIKLRSRNWYNEQVLGINDADNIAAAKEQMKAYILGTNNEKENKTMTATELRRIEAEAYGKGYARGMEDTIRAARSTYGFAWNNDLKIKKVIFNDPATIVFWADGTKTVAKAHGDDKFDKEVGLTVCIAKKALGNRSNFDKVFKKWIK
jgi:hypothetical protein